MPQKGYQAGFPYTGGAGSGRGKYVDPSGAVYEGEFMDDKKHGRGTIRDADGSVEHDGFWENGEPVAKKLRRHRNYDLC